MPGDARQPKKHRRIRFYYSREIRVYDQSQPGKPSPAIVDTGYTKARRRRISGVFYFLTGASASCLGAVVIAPNPVVQATALTVWAGSVGLARFFLAGAYPKKRKRRS